MRIPRWESATQTVGVLGAHARAAGALEEGPYTASECEQPPSTLAVSFFLANERDEAVGEGDRVWVRDTVIYPSAQALAGDDPTQDVYVDQLAIQSAGGDPVSLMGTVDGVAWQPTSRSLPPRLVLLHDHSFDAAEHDSTDQRLAALSELVGEALCHETKAVNCPLPSGAWLSLYRLYDNQVNQLLQRTRDYDDLQSALDVLRNAGELGDAPHIVGPSNEPGGVVRAVGECSGGDAASTCWPAVVLIAGEVNESLPSPAALDSLPEGTRFFGAGLTDSPALRRLACRSGGFFEEISRGADLRLLSDKSTGGIPDYAYGFARKVLLAAQGRWEALLTLTGLPADLDMSATHVLRGTLNVRLGESPNEHIASSDFAVTIGGY